MRRLRDQVSIVGSFLLAMSGCKPAIDGARDADGNAPLDAGGVATGDAGGVATEDAGGIATGDAGGANDGGDGGARTAVAYTGSAAPKTATAGLLNIGQQFEVTTARITIRDLGFWDQGAD